MEAECAKKLKANGSGPPPVPTTTSVPSHKASLRLSHSLRTPPPPSIITPSGEAALVPSTRERRVQQLGVLGRSLAAAIGPSPLAVPRLPLITTPPRHLSIC
ncbi:MAG: hypothetical protein WDW38_007522 [Sanguina aurantia]